MCGIAGIINFNGTPVREADVKTMLKCIKHRGPDDEGIFLDNNIGLGHIRLSIIDLSYAGHQPMISNDGRYIIVYNGEIYNYLELKEELKTDYQFRSKTDTEVILAAYQKWGEKCLDRFNGMFAFVIFDKTKKEIFGARDRYGVKPFYYYMHNNTLFFSSEIKAILPLLKERTENNKIIFDYLVYGYLDHTNETFFKDVFKLNHGYYLTIRNGEIKFKRWYILEDKISKPEIKSEDYRELFKNSLKLRLRSDVPIGVCLSGGLDSSSIVASLIKDFKIHDLATFSSVYGTNEPNDEGKFIDEFRPMIKNMHKTYPSADTLFSNYDDFIATLQEPSTDLGPYIQYEVMKLAKDHVKVTLDGQGADEQLAGYHNFFGSYYIELFKKFKFIKLFSENIYYIKNHKSRSGLTYFIKYLMPGVWWELAKAKRLSSINIDFIDMQKINSNSNTPFKPVSLKDNLVKHFQYKLEHLLRWEDLNAMRFSIEARVPFLDYHLVEATLSLHSSSIIERGTSKFILREAMKDVLPINIYKRQDKKGFSNPKAKWFRSDKFEELIKDTINSSKFINRGYFNSKKANLKYGKHLKCEIDSSDEIWKWLNLEIWFRKFIDK